MFIKVVKNKAYFKRFETKFRRRREGKTDYYARKRLIIQDKTKYNTPKYRLVVRITNKDVIAQITSATIKGDKVHSVAYAHELPRYGMPVGLTNYASCYAVGLLLARRWLTTIKLAEKYVGKTEVTGAHYNPADDHTEGRRPFKCFLDVGLARTTTGARVFAVLKGAVDGGLNIPYEDKRFPGYDKEVAELGNKAEYQGVKLRHYILGGHVADYMGLLKEEDEDRYNKQFSRFIKNGLTAENLTAAYIKLHAAIRANPSPKAKKAESEAKPKSYKQTKRPYHVRKERVRQILAKRAAAAE